LLRDQNYGPSNRCFSDGSDRVVIGVHRFYVRDGTPRRMAHDGRQHQHRSPHITEVRWVDASVRPTHAHRHIRTWRGRWSPHMHAPERTGCLRTIFGAPPPARSNLCYEREHLTRSNRSKDAAAADSGCYLSVL
jgi:hypothetical protein